MRKQTLGFVPLALLLASSLPLHADGGTPDCFNPTTSLASQVRGPTSGDERFLLFPAGPSNVMFVLDSSGSMITLPQCGDMTVGRGWGGTGQPLPNRCGWPLNAGIAQAGRVAFPAYATSSGADLVGTCDVAGDSALSWMLSYKPDLTGSVYDPGHAATGEGLTDSPTWGGTCNGDNCLFNPTGIYHFQWDETSARQFPDCAIRNSDGTRDTNYPLPTAAQATACQTCLDTAGFYFMQGRSSGGRLQNQILFRGGWLNKNPPKFMAARKVIKDLAWTDLTRPQLTDSMRFGLSILADPDGVNRARIIVPLGPATKATIYPLNQHRTEMVAARQAMIDALNRTDTNQPSFVSGSTPLAWTLLGVGQYLSSPNLYTRDFGSSFELSDLLEATVGGTNHCSICWACQHANIILVTDGSPNNEAPLPSTFDTYDDTTYHLTDNCGPGSSCSSGQTATCPRASDVTATPQRARDVGTARIASAVGTPVAPRPALASSVGTPVNGTRVTPTPGATCNRNGGCTCGSGTIARGQTCYLCPAPDNLIPRSSTYTCGYRCPGSTALQPGSLCGYRCPSTTAIVPGSTQCFLTCNGTTPTTNTICGYTCPGTTTPTVTGTTICGYSCPGDASGAPLHSGGEPCYALCDGDATHYASGHVCWATCPNDTQHYTSGATCPCTCPGGYPASAAGDNCPVSHCCSPSDSSSNPPSRLPRVASWLHGSDLRTDLAGSRNQSVETYTVSFGLVVPTLPDYNPAVEILKATANMGGGKPYNASDAVTLASAVYTAINRVAERVTAFSAPAAASLSTLRSVAVEAVLTRFKPNDTATWEGHVYQGMLFDEFLNGCDPTKKAEREFQRLVSCGGKDVSANFDGSRDANGNATCSGVFLVDADCDQVEEDPSTGAVLKKGTGSPANLFWDAGFVLSKATYDTGPKAGQAVPGYRAADARKIYSVLSDKVTELNATNASSFAPFMNLDTAWCRPRLQLWGICGTSPLSPCSDVVPQCAKAIIDFVHGWDVTSTGSCGGPDRTTNDASCPGGRERAWKLGDVFHSAPVVVRPPRDELSCGTGFENQCTATLYSPPSFANQTQIQKTTVGGKDIDAYEMYRRDKAKRQQVVLVGANDGMLHAFDAGVADPSAPNDALVIPFSRGTGEELWAFVPPDLLPRLKDLTESHQYMVDGNVMVKDIWVDGSTADPTKPGTPDNVKQWESGREEYHTVAVMSERAGGPHYTALDITDVTKPVFLWSFPKPGSDDARYMAQSWNDFAPGPPPIGPVRMALEDGDADPTGRQFKELWITMINGGYDPTLTRGRAVFMLDVWTGRTIWRFTDDDFKTTMGYTGSSTSMFPVAGSVGAVDIGDTSKPDLDKDGFYDTATWADLGGNVFVARFWNKGVIDTTTGRVNNWFAARAFEEQRRNDNAQYIAGRSPIFFMPDNVFDAATHSLRTFVGSGNRERSLAPGNECNPDNLLGCCTAGCSVVKATATDDFGSCRTSGAFECKDGQLLIDPSASDCSGSLACGPFTGSASVQFACPGATATVNVTVNANVTCDAAGVCTTPTRLGTDDVGTLPALTTASRFYGIWSFGGAAGKRFDTREQAQTFEANRFTDVAFTGCTSVASSCSLVDVTQAVASYDPALPSHAGVSCRSGTVCQATSSDPGWFYEYGKVCPLSSCTDTTWYDEKTGAPASTVFGCVAWGGFRAVSTTGSSDPCASGDVTAQVYGYMADYLSGAPSATCGFKYSNQSTSGYARAVQRTTVASPNAQTIRVVVSPSGEVKYQGLEFPPAAGGAGSVIQTDFGTRTDTSETMYWLEVPRDLHDCRHDAARSASTCQ